MPIPYMGSKAKSARHIFNVINAFTKDRKENLLVDLFTGGFAISEVFIQEGWKTINNDKNKYVMALLKKTLEGLPNEVYNWISREKYKDVINNPDKYEDWFVGYVQCIWSYGNNQHGYLYGKNVEELKKQADDLVVKKEVGKIIKELIPQKYIDGILKQDSIGKRRIALKKVVNAMIKKMNEKKSSYLEKIQKLKKIQNLERLQSLERLQKLSKTINKNNILQITSKSYEEVEIPKNAIVYCDPPYANRFTYAEGGFDHNKFWEYVRKLSKTNKVFVSEYTAPKDFRVIYEFSQKSRLQGGTQQHNNQPNECLFVYNG